MRVIPERRGPQVRRPLFALRGRGRGRRALAAAALAGGAAAMALIAAARPADARTARIEAAAPTLGQVCLAAADAAADAHRVPRAVLRALTRAETGRARGGALEPWPWTVNMEGAGRWFETRAEAEAYVAQEQARGARSFDVGCFQINHRWHGEAFASVSQMFDPRANADYAARFMAGLHAETGDWGRAAGFYHSRTPEFFGRYRARFEKIMASAGPDEPRLALGRVEDGAAPGAGAGAADHPVYGRRATRLAQDESRVARPLPSWTEMASVAQSAGGVAVKLAAGGGGGLLRKPTGRLVD